MFAIMFKRTIVSDVVQGIIVSGGLGFVTVALLINNKMQYNSCMSMKSIFMWNFSSKRTVFLDVIQGILIGAGLAFITIFIFPKAYVAKVNGWTTMYGCSEPGNGILLRGACAITFMGPINVPQEAMYWTTKVDDAGQKLSGAHNYIMHFAAGQLPPNNAFWSLTMGDAKNQFVPNPLNRFSVSDRSGLVSNADGSVDIYIQNAASAGNESNWLPAPTGNFILWLRVYLPGQAVLDGEYQVPPVVEVK
jgi:hypothetical protein